MHMHRARSPISCRQCKISAAINSRGYRSPDSPLLPAMPNSIGDGAATLNALENYGSPEKTIDGAETKTKCRRATKRGGSCVTRVWPSNQFEWVSNRLGRRSIVLLAEQLVLSRKLAFRCCSAFNGTPVISSLPVHVAPHPCHLCIIFPLRSLFHSAYSPLLKRVNSASRARDKWIQSHREHWRSQCSSGLIQFSSELGRIIFILILHLIIYNCVYNYLHFFLGLYVKLDLLQIRILLESQTRKNTAATSFEMFARIYFVSLSFDIKIDPYFKIDPRNKFRECIRLNSSDSNLII